MKNEIKCQTAREYRTKHGKQMPTLKLARIMYEESKPMFSSVEDARHKLRYIEGKVGEKDRKYVKNTEFFVATPRVTNPYKLPTSEETFFNPYVIRGYKKIAIFSDIHVPYHSIEAITVALDWCKKEKPDLLLLNGDTLDMYQLSRFDKDPRKRNFAHELKTMEELLLIFQKTLKCPILFKKGNHSERYESFLFAKAKELIGVEEFDLDNIIRKRVKDIEIVGDKRIIHANNLNIVHGHEFSQGFFSPVNVARGLALRAKASALQGHNHQTSEHTSIDINGKLMTTWSTGCLCELHPRYAPINNWNWGFAMVELDPNGQDFHVQNKRILKGKVL